MHKLHYKFLLISAFILANCMFAHSQSVNDKTAAIDFLKIKNQEIVRAFETAKAYPRPVLLIFEASWCPYCKKLKDETMQDEKVLETLLGFEKLNIDVDENPEDAAFFDGKPASQGGSGIPAIIIFTPEGKELARVSGFHDAKDFDAFLKKQLKKIEKAELFRFIRPEELTRNISDLTAINLY